MPVHGAEVIFRPGGKGVVEFCRQAKRDLFFLFCHISVQAAGIDNRLRVVVPAENDEQV